LSPFLFLLNHSPSSLSSLMCFLLTGSFMHSNEVEGYLKPLRKNNTKVTGTMREKFFDFGVPTTAVARPMLPAGSNMTAAPVSCVS
jgi:hypothetical protein